MAAVIAAAVIPIIFGIIIFIAFQAYINRHDGPAKNIMVSLCLLVILVIGVCGIAVVSCTTANGIALNATKAL